MAKKKVKIIPFLKDAAEDYTRMGNLIGDYVKAWIPIFGLERWDIDISYVSSTAINHENAVAEVSSSFEYRNAEITFYLQSLRGKTNKVLESCVVHELVHLMVKPIQAKDCRITDLEQVVTELTTTFMKVKYPTK